MKKIQKISIIGAGAIGTQTALYLQQEAMYLHSKSVREIVLYNHNYDLAYGEASDIADSMSFHEQFSETAKLTCKVIPSYQLEDVANSDIIIITAGATKAALKNKDRGAELPITYEIARQASLAIRQYAKDALVIVVTNPVDIITWFIQEMSGLKKNMVIGVGVASDSARYAYNIKEELKKYNVKVDSVNSLVIGAHRGKDMVMVESAVKINDEPIQNLKKYNLTEEDLREILDKAKEQTYDRGFVIAKNKRQRAASINPATIASTIASVYLRKKTIKLPTALVLSSNDLKKYNIDFKREVCAGVMTIIGPNGAEIEKLDLNEQEKTEFINSMQETIKIKENFERDIQYKDSNNSKEYIFNDESDTKNIEVNPILNLYANNDNLNS